MHTVYTLSPADLDEKFLQALKLLFGGKTIEIAVREVDSTSASHDLWQAIQHFRQQMNLADYHEDEDIFADVRDRSTGREVVL